MANMRRTSGFENGQRTSTLLPRMQRADAAASKRRYPAAFGTQRSDWKQRCPVAFMQRLASPFVLASHAGVNRSTVAEGCHQLHLPGSQRAPPGTAQLCSCAPEQ